MIDHRELQQPLAEQVAKVPLHRRDGEPVLSGIVRQASLLRDGGDALLGGARLEQHLQDARLNLLDLLEVEVDVLQRRFAVDERSVAGNQPVEVDLAQ
jgi:hypothetical protein